MGLGVSFVRALTVDKLRGLRLGGYLLTRGLRLGLNTALPFIFKNHVEPCRFNNIPQPNTFNSFQEFDLSQDIGKLKFILDFQNVVTQKQYRHAYGDYLYSSLVKAYVPKKMSVFENLNINRAWDSSYFNENLATDPNKFEKYRHSDALFADIMVNTQGAYQAKKVRPGDEETIYFIKNHFKEVLEKNRKIIDKSEKYKDHENVIDALIEDNNLYFIDFPSLHQVQNNEVLRRQIGGSKYSRNVTTTKGTSFTAYLEIPFAIFSEVEDYYHVEGKTRKKDFICLGSVFNNRNEVYHPFDGEDMMMRDRWQMAKCHIASAAANQFTTKNHLGELHLQSGIFTTAFVNVAKSDSSLAWMKTDFIDLLTKGLLNTNFAAHQTLIDKYQGLFERIFYLGTQQSIELILNVMKQTNMMDFCPEKLGANCYQSDTVKISENLYQKYETYINYLFEKNKKSWQGKEQRIGNMIYNEVRGGGQFCGLSKEITQDNTQKSLKKLMTNLAYLWCVHHGQTFSNVSVLNNFYIAPTTMRKPLSALPDHPLNPKEKQDFICSVENAEDNLNLIKAVTYRSTNKSIISNWNDRPIDFKMWSRMEENQEEEKKFINFTDHWDSAAKETFNMNSSRTDDGLFNLHWLQVNELPHCHNI